MECPYCKKVFETKYSLKTILKQRGEDIGKNEFICLKCSKTLKKLKQKESIHRWFTINNVNGSDF